MITLTGTGNVVFDPEVKDFGGGKQVTKLRVASWNGKDEKLFINLECWDDLAANVAASISKGDKVVFSGVLREDSWQTKDGDARRQMKVSVREVGPSLAFATATVEKIVSDGAPRHSKPVLMGDDEEAF